MLGLAIESADRTASAALWRSDADCGSSKRGCDLLEEGTLPPEAGKADQLITVIEQLLDEQGLDYGDLDVIAVNRGPGSFTGIRSAVALGRGLALATGLPVLGVTSHEVLAAILNEDESERQLVIALDARRGEVFAQAFGLDGRPLGEIEARAPAALADDLKAGSWRLSGSGARLVAETLDGGVDVEMIEAGPLRAGAVASAAAMRLSRGEAPIQGFALLPLYVRAPDAVPSAPLISATKAVEVSV